MERDDDLEHRPARRVEDELGPCLVESSPPELCPLGLSVSSPTLDTAHSSVVAERVAPDSRRAGSRPRRKGGYRVTAPPFEGDPWHSPRTGREASQIEIGVDHLPVITRMPVLIAATTQNPKRNVDSFSSPKGPPPSPATRVQSRKKKIATSTNKPLAANPPKMLAADAIGSVHGTCLSHLWNSVASGTRSRTHAMPLRVAATVFDQSMRALPPTRRFGLSVIMPEAFGPGTVRDPNRPRRAEREGSMNPKDREFLPSSGQSTTPSPEDSPDSVTSAAPSSDPPARTVWDKLAQGWRVVEVRLPGEEKAPQPPERPNERSDELVRRLSVSVAERLRERRMKRETREAKGLPVN